jgi:hypothetical protein
VYNYGYFDFRTPNFYLKFVKGDLQYFVAVDNFENFMPEYEYYQRGVYEQTLNFNQSQKQKIFDDLTSVLASENRFYTYKFIDRNCTTMVLDVLLKNASIDLSLDIEGKNQTNREILYGYLDNHFFEKLGINVIFGAKPDADFSKIFLPKQLLGGLSKSKINGNKLVSDYKVLNIQSAEPVFSVWNNIYVFCLFFVLIVIVNKKWLQTTYLIIVGLLGLVLLSVGFYSFHEEVSYNYNAMLFNPIYLVLVLFLYQKNFYMVRNTIIVLIGILFFYTLYILNKPFLLIFVPIIITNLILVYRIYHLNNKHLEGNKLR